MQPPAHKRFSRALPKMLSCTLSCTHHGTTLWCTWVNTPVTATGVTQLIPRGSPFGKRVHAGENAEWHWKLNSTTLKQGRKAPLIFTTSPCTNYAAATWPPTCLPVGHWGHTCEPLGTMHPSFQRQRTHIQNDSHAKLGETSCPPNSRTHFYWQWTSRTKLPGQTFNHTRTLNPLLCQPLPH